MDMIPENNYVRLCGTLAGSPAYSHTSRGQDFFTFPLKVERLSGNCDIINIVLRRAQLDALETAETEKLMVTGQLRSFNNRRGQGAKLIITVLAKELSLCDGADENTVLLLGTLCKPPNPRITPMGRDICDLMLAVNRRFGRSDYLPVICWGAKARQAAQWSVGQTLSLKGRIQSRIYIKMTDEGTVEKTAFEVSAAEIEPE